MKRKTVEMIPIVAASLTVGYIFVLSWVAGHVIGKLGGGKAEGMPGRIKSIVIPVGRWRLHLHHWVCSLGLMIASLTCGFHAIEPQVTYGFLGGLAFQGIYCYGDWHRFLSKKGS